MANLTKASCTPIDYDKLIDDVLYSENYLEATQIRRPEIIAKRKKPAWAKTEKENQIDEEEQIDDLVEFMDNFDPKSYIEDVEVKSLIENIMERVEQVKDSTLAKKPFKSPSVRFSTNSHIRPHRRHEIKHNDCNSGANPFTKQPLKTIKRPATAAAIKELQHVTAI